jgi:hypothetical protein
MCITQDAIMNLDQHKFREWLTSAEPAFASVASFAFLPSLSLWLLILAMATSTRGAPGDENWDDQFVATNAPNGMVDALACSGTNLYVGGNFTTAGCSRMRVRPMPVALPNGTASLGRHWAAV